MLHSEQDVVIKTYPCTFCCCFYCGEPAISLPSHHVSLVQWTTRLLPVMRDPGSIPREVLMWNQDSPGNVVSLHWWPRRDWSLWPCLRWALSCTITRPSCQQCDNPTWSHTALLSQFHTHCMSFRLHNRHSRLLGGSPVESLQSHCLHTMSLVQWTTRLLPVMRDSGSIPRGVLMWNRDSPVSVVSLYYCVLKVKKGNTWFKLTSRKSYVNELLALFLYMYYLFLIFNTSILFCTNLEYISHLFLANFTCHFLPDGNTQLCWTILVSSRSLTNPDNSVHVHSDPICIPTPPPPHVN